MPLLSSRQSVFRDEGSVFGVTPRRRALDAGYVASSSRITNHESRVTNHEPPFTTHQSPSSIPARSHVRRLLQPRPEFQVAGKSPMLPRPLPKPRKRRARSQPGKILLVTFPEAIHHVLSRHATRQACLVSLPGGLRQRLQLILDCATLVTRGYVHGAIIMDSHPFSSPRRQAFHPTARPVTLQPQRLGRAALCPIRPV